MRGRTKPFKASVEHLCVEADLALLRVLDDASGFERLVPTMELKVELPRLQDKLQVCVFVCIHT